MDYEVRDKVFFENLFDMEFQEAVENAVLYNGTFCDSHSNF